MLGYHVDFIEFLRIAFCQNEFFKNLRCHYFDSKHGYAAFFYTCWYLGDMFYVASALLRQGFGGHDICKDWHKTASLTTIMDGWPSG